jgi:teichuronic acid exporter
LGADIGDLKTQTFKGGIQIGGATIALRITSIISGIILARLLDPGDFGLVALVYVVLATTNLFSGLGMAPAVIQSRAPVERTAFQAFVVTALSGTALFVLLEIFAPFFAGLLGNEATLPLLRWMALLVLFGSITTVPEALLQKQLLFGRVSTIMIGTELVNMSLAIGLALAGFGVWSLVYAGLVRSVTNFALVWTLSPRRPWIRPQPWDGALMRDLLSYGVKATGGGVTTFIYSVTDNFIVGRLLGTVPLGFYSKAYDFTTRTVDSLNNVIGAVLLPSYAKMQGDPDRLARAYLKSLRIIAMMIVPVCMGMYVTAPEMIPALVGAKWFPMVAPFEVLAFAAMIKPLSATTSTLFMSVGRPGYNFRAGLCVLGFLIPFIFLFLGWGITGVAYAVLVAHLAGFSYNMYQVHRVLPGTGRRMVGAIVPALGSAAVMVGALTLMKAPLRVLTGGSTGALFLGILIIFGILVYGGMLLLIQRPLVIEVLGLAHRRFAPREAEGETK